MIRTLLLPVLSVAGIVFALYTVAQGERPTAVAPPVSAPALAPYRQTIAGSGIVEAASQNIAIGTPIAGIIAEVAVRQGQALRKGEVLLRIDDREFAAEARVRQVSVEAAQVELEKLEALPRSEDLPPARARLVAAEALELEAGAQLQRAQSIEDKRAISNEELARRTAVQGATNARVAEARAELDKLLAGAWAPDLAVARAKLEQAKALAAQTQIQLERLVVRAPIDGVVLQVNARVGEFAPSGVLQQPLILFGDLSTLHVRVDIDESEAWRLRPGSNAVARVRGNSAMSVDLAFVRVDPYVVPKRSLTGDTSERVDTRVLQVIYGFDPSALQVFVGQQMDVFVDAEKPEGEDK
jgi:multidrug resistance efflux pump